MSSKEEPSQLVRFFSSSRDVNEKVSLVWENIVFQTLVRDEKAGSFMDKRYKEKKILGGICGQAQSGELIAVLGPTGSGKTSLLNVLAARVPAGGSDMNKLSGSIYLNGKLRDEIAFRSISAYVLQDDDLYAHLTVYETFKLAASFYMSVSATEEEVNNLVNSVISELGLAKAANTRIGNEKVRGVSGGERKRTSIGVQLICDPAVLFLDEPTSGLDAFQSQAVMESIKSLTDNNRLVMTVIHQPRSSIFDMFDKMLILSEGQLMYFGLAKDGVEYFSSHGHVCPHTFNPADFFLDTLSPDNRTMEDELATKNRIKHLAGVWDKLDRAELSTKRLQHIEALQKENRKEIQKIGGGETIDKVFTNFKLLCWRTWSEQSRNTTTFKFKMVMSIIFGLIVGGIWSDIGKNQASIQDRVGVCFFVAINQTFNSTIGVFNTFPKEKAIVDRERDGKAYNTLSYYAAKWLLEIPLNLIPPFVFGTIVYYIVGLNNGGHQFGYFLLVIAMVNLVGISMGLAVSSYCSDVETATAIGMPLNIIGVIFGGFYINVNALPFLAEYIPYFSLFRWCLQALTTNEFIGLNFNCDRADPTQCIPTGEEALKDLGFGGHTIQYPLFGMFMLLLGWMAAGYLILLLSQRKYTSVGHTGDKFARLQNVVIESTNGVDSTMNSGSSAAAVLGGSDAGRAGYEMVSTIDANKEDK